MLSLAIGIALSGSVPSRVWKLTACFEREGRADRRFFSKKKWEYLIAKKGMLLDPLKISKGGPKTGDEYMMVLPPGAFMKLERYSVFQILGVQLGFLTGVKISLVRMLTEPTNADFKAWAEYRLTQARRIEKSQEELNRERGGRTAPQIKLTKTQEMEREANRWAVKRNEECKERLKTLQEKITDPKMRCCRDVAEIPVSFLDGECVADAIWKQGGAI